jgi:glycoside/pentoside/hexuronide:cation symporter, GPH family
MSDAAMMPGSERATLWRISLFAAVLSAAGLPLYVHLPVFALSSLNLDLATVGLVLLGLRSFDFLQDPLLGRLVDRWPDHAGHLAAASLSGLAAGLFLLFAVPPMLGPVAWLVLTLILVFTSFSLASILFYARGVGMAEARGGHLHLAGYREGGLLAGVLVVTIAPGVFDTFLEEPYRAYGLMLALMVLAAIPLTAPLWRVPVAAAPAMTLTSMLTPAVRQFLLIGLVNSLPVAFTSTLFLLFVRDQLVLEGWAGPFLLAFFLAAGLAAPVWTVLAKRFGARPVLVTAMSLAVASFFWASQLGAGDAWPFLLICILSGATMSADIIILPALFSQRLAQQAGSAGIGFGLWNFVSKMSFALAAGLIALADLFLPGTLGGAGVTGLSLLTIGYALVPCLLKIVAILLVFNLSGTEVTQ